MKGARSTPALSREARGYGSKHRRIRQQYARMVAAGRAQCSEVVCVMPTRWIAPGMAWDLAHGPTRDTYLGPAHARCNRSEGGKRSGVTRATTPGVTILARIRSRTW